jgi:hypothetical protein
MVDIPHYGSFFNGKQTSCITCKKYIGATAPKVADTMADSHLLALLS